jgi:hypothetical protein
LQSSAVVQLAAWRCIWWQAVFYWMVDVVVINAYIIWYLGNGIGRRKDSHHGGRYDFLVRLVKKLAGVKDSGAGTAGSSMSLAHVSGFSQHAHQARSASCRRRAMTLW